MPTTLETSHTYKNYWPPKGSKIAVCMSGGVDSSTSALILKEKGYETIGLTGWLIKGSGRCCDNGMINALKVCEQIGVNHISKDLRVFFKQEIVDPFINSYQAGSTPIPCIACNNTIKWGLLMQYAFDELNCTHIATGHYAKLTVETCYNKPLYKIVRPKDLKKDQTFMLWGLNQEVLSRTVFPLGDLIKEEVREIAKERNLVVADKEESQDICFISDKEGTQGFLGKYLESKEGYIIENKTGNILGIHQGTHNYTIGQRKGIGIAYSEPLYVIDLDVENNIIYAGTKDELEGCELIAKNVNWIVPSHVIARSKATKPRQRRAKQSPNVSQNEIALSGSALLAMTPKQIRAKIRYNSKTYPAMVSMLDNNKVKVIFHEPQLAVTPGQACVFYDETDQILLGGGWII
ncbi:MAG: tRNA 2-thiouridine(34) synthase MnmA [Candidatus Melainabacteria bacterium RIFCSPLOWO2_02_FULL_35_15]|nr:MAG: tRNA 2-thiouridine(34) synthase MnmA [Candidatus Melainabacteria bacterium RIFCSPLOWO2_12_FULL_35_11]OGI13713.1 MAG: tRNA 2-thiouridine(34) synthase MnmA [Candidatus Melainabacteria bacterium RIFCSPLOWO2_02_FULL_35_15]